MRGGGDRWPLVIVSGRELAQLMIELGVGVILRPEYVPDIDPSFFLEE